MKFQIFVSTFLSVVVVAVMLIEIRSFDMASWTNTEVVLYSWILPFFTGLMAFGISWLIGSLIAGIKSDG